jgi:spore coat protein SA
VRICHVAPELLPVPPVRGGAIERWIRDAARLLAARGHQVHVVSRDHGDQAREATIDGVQYHFVRVPALADGGRRAPFLRGLAYFSAAGRVLRRVRPDVVHHHSRPGGLSVTCAIERGARAVLSLHSMDYGWNFGYAAWDRALFARGFRASARVLSVSEFIGRHARERYPMLAEKLTTLYNGVDCATFHPDSDARFDTEEPTILYVGRVEERKGVHLLLDAFERVISRRIAGATLKIVGPHSYWHAEPSPFYVELARRCRTIPRVQLRGPTYLDADLANVYRSGTVSVVPSVVPEALGLTSLEAQACGVPVVVSRAGGLPETVLEGRSGLVFENGDRDGLAAALLELLSDPARLRALSASARAWAVKQFSWERVGSELETIYAQVAA